MALTVGLHENVVLGEKTALNDKGTLSINFKTKQAAVNLLDEMEAGNSTAVEECSLLQFPFSAKIQNKDRSSNEIGDSTTTFRKQLIDILAVFMPEERAQAALALQSVCLLGLGVTVENFTAKLQDQNFLDAFYANTCRAFLTAANPFINGPTFRVKLARTNAAKHFAKIPARGKFPEPWIESMSVPKTSSKVAWTKYELDNNLNNGTPTPTEAKEVASANQAAMQFMAPPTAVGTAPVIDPFAPTAQAAPTTPPAFQQG